MKIIIDATNIKAGGGLTHLIRIIESFRPTQNSTIELIGGNWLDNITDFSWLSKKIIFHKFNSIIKQEWFKQFRLHKLLLKGSIAFIPGGTFSSSKIPYISMSQNMLVFDKRERNRFPMSFTWIRYQVLEHLQVRSFRNAKGIIYISYYAKNYIEKKYPDLKNKRSIVIYHGISDDFRQNPKIQFPIDSYTKKKSFKILYVSIVNFYKHQWHLINVIKRFRLEGFNIELELIGPIYKPAERLLNTSLKGAESYVFYKGKVPYEEISKSYKSADLFVFASTCENMPNILVEAMSAGLPILCSNYGPMPEILKDAGEYTDPTDEKEMYEKLKALLLCPEKRAQFAQKAYDYSFSFSWEKTSKETFDYIQKIALENNIQ